ncbi:inositol 1,4,5-triphosphate receptor associated 2-like [Erethizon dorsatum]
MELLKSPPVHPVGRATAETTVFLLHPVSSVGVGKIIDYLRQTRGQDLEDSGLEELWTMLDPEKRDPRVDLDTFHAAVKDWMASCRPKWEGVKSKFSGIAEDSVFEKQDSVNSGGAIKMTTAITDSATGNFEALRGDVSQGVLDVSDLITYVADLHFNKQKLEEENHRFKLALESSEEANSQLTEDCAELRLQVKSTHQAIMRTNLLKEELEELKITMNALEEQKSMTETQNKQLETENRALILKIRVLQEEDLKNAMDIDRLEKKIEELSETETEHQMQLHTYQNTLLNKEASIQEKDLRIEELKSTIIEYRSITEHLRGEKNELAHEVQQLQQELIISGIQLKANREHSVVISEGENSLHHELILAQSAELEEISEVGMFIDGSFQWVTNPEITVKEKWVQQLTEFKHIMEKKLNLCGLRLNSLEIHKESLDKVSVKLLEILKEFSQKQLEALKQLQEDAANQEAILWKRIQEANKQLEDAKQQAKAREWPAHSTSGRAESVPRELEEAILEQRNLHAINTELANACQTLEQKTRTLKMGWVRKAIAGPWKRFIE